MGNMRIYISNTSKAPHRHHRLFKAQQSAQVKLSK